MYASCMNTRPMMYWLLFPSFVERFRGKYGMLVSPNWMTFLNGYRKSCAKAVEGIVMFTTPGVLRGCPKLSAFW